MTRLKFQFLVFFVLLAITLGSLLAYSYAQISREEQRLWEGIAENTFNQMQAAISELLSVEDQRSFSEYRYYYIPASQQQGYALNISPLATLPHEDQRGIVGYFQINPDGSFHTPYVPPTGDQDRLGDISLRRALNERLNEITRTLQGDLGAGKGILEISQKITHQQERSHQDASIPRSALYPNPLKRTEKLGSQGSSPTITSEKSLTPALEAEEEGVEDYQQEAVANIAQFQTFQEQKIVGSDLGTDDQGEGQKDEVLVVQETTSVLTDPFRARLIGWQDIIFYRKVWLDQKMYIQGFVVDLRRFYSWLMGLSFENSHLPGFSVARLQWGERVLVHSGTEGHGDLGKRLFTRDLGYPLHQFAWNIYFKDLPRSSSRNVLYILTALLTLISTIGLLTIYRSAASEVVLSQKRQDFVAAVTHELKTPLTSIRMYSEMLKEGWVTEDAKKQEYYQLMTKEGERLGRLIDHVLHLARLEKRHDRLNLVTAPPREDFEMITRELEDLATKNGFEWQVSSDKNLPTITYDVDALKQVLIILIDNSLKFSQDSVHKVITVRLKDERGAVVWSVSDKGPGIPKNELEKVFEKFYRVENEMTRQTKGTGIGLAMARMIVSGMGAKIEALNLKEGGLCVRMIFKPTS